MTTATMHRAVVDAEFRAIVLEDDSLSTLVPAPVEDLDVSALEEWQADIAAGDIVACQTSCSFGLFTVYCDGSSK